MNLNPYDHRVQKIPVVTSALYTSAQANLPYKALRAYKPEVRAAKEDTVTGSAQTEIDIRKHKRKSQGKKSNMHARRTAEDADMDIPRSIGIIKTTKARVP
ncbi:hypothetical protein C8R44DRAFT_731691 [Mycena epipterygia]|nr:hypothetical protein C8R44DRAFT_731691 [Mycena epipterygia]